MIGVETPGVGITATHGDETADEMADSPDGALSNETHREPAGGAESGPPAGPNEDMEKLALAALAVVAVAVVFGGL